MKQLIDAAALTIQEEEKHWTANDIPIMTATISVPQCKVLQNSRIFRRLNRYYRQCTRSFLSYCSHVLYPQALAEFQEACRTGGPLPHAYASLRCTITCNEKYILSLYLDCTEREHTKQALTLRRADTWDLTTGFPISARECFSPGTKVRKTCLSFAKNHCQQQSDAGLSIYADDLSFRLRRYLSLRNFYLDPEGFYFFYQPYMIAPPVEGCPTFFIPFADESGPFWPISL